MTDDERDELVEGDKVTWTNKAGHKKSGEFIDKGPDHRTLVIEESDGYMCVVETAKLERA